MSEPTGDLSDPAVRAAARVRERERGEAARRTAAGVALVAVALVAPFAAAPVTGDGGATVGAVVGSLLLLGCAVAVWPWEWSAQERRHHELMAIWSEARGVEGEPVPWDRYAAWADAEGERIVLWLLCRRGSASDHPTPVSMEEVRRIDAEDMAEAAGAMEGLREDAAAREAKARERHLEGISAAERRAHEEALRRVEAAADERERRAEEAMRRELAEEEAAERRAQAEAVARALRRR
jgi:hypothetical protein